MEQANSSRLMQILKDTAVIDSQKKLYDEYFKLRDHGITSLTCSFGR